MTTNTTKPRHRLSTTADLAAGAQVTLEGNPAHYLAHVLRLGVGDVVAVFNRTGGEWAARIAELRKKTVILSVETQLRPPAPMLGLTVCFAPIKGGRMETIIEKATELGAATLQPVLTQRTIVDRVNLERADSIAREAAEQCERTDWPEIREPVKLTRFLGDWPADVPLIYGDESGASGSVSSFLMEGGLTPPSSFGLTPAASGLPSAAHTPIEVNRPSEPRASRAAESFGGDTPSGALALLKPSQWGVLAGPEGGFTPEEFAALKHCKAAVGVGLGPRILRADTAIITLTALTLAAWGDWDHAPRFTKP